ncbi:rhomboid family intramembrane serine protease [Bowmanella sp. Y26]|uniref:rhomboid family intramembrane serine protease n=1 Tax=Bowmanella yangjiangensis TaxID=2811230 RepID=UPI001BDCE256|nr:rhomboid family intramembrane serine protease [Bowmanella yangjiangensis]
MPIKPCPRCKDKMLTPTSYKTDEIDVCQACGGLWFEKDEVNRMINELHEDVPDSQYTDHFGKHLGDSELNCPDCHQSLQRYHLLADYHAEIDHCHACDGSWIDRSELRGVQQSPALQSALATLNEKINWKTYLFQFLSQMPVEYNLKPRIRPVVNWTLLLLNALIFALYYFDEQSFIWTFQHLAAVPSQVLAGEHAWTLLTCIFLHGSLLHLAGNLYFLYVVGDNLEDALGHKRYLGLYLLCGLAASVVGALVRSGSDIPSVGASGAIAGLFGMYLMWFRHASLTFMFVIFQKKLSAVWFFAIWVAFNILGMALGDTEVDYGAHLGGFATGLLIGWWLKDKVLAANPMISLLNQQETVIRR